MKINYVLIAGMEKNNNFRLWVTEAYFNMKKNYDFIFMKTIENE